MSKLQIDPECSDESTIEDEVLSALRDGFLQLETPTGAGNIETTVRQEITSGKDFDPLPRQIGRRVVWIAMPTIMAFVVATGVLALCPIPRVPLTRWLESQNKWVPRQPIPPNIDQLYQPMPAFLPLNVPADGFKTRLPDMDAPKWFRKAPPISQKIKPGPVVLTVKGQGKGSPK